MSRSNGENVQLALFGASGDVGNLGIEALMRATLSSVRHALPASMVTVFDYGRGLREDVTSDSRGQLDYRRCGMWPSRRLHRSESISNVRLASRLRGAWNPVSRHLFRQTAALDLSGGDSFTDLYGPARFRGVTLRKQVVLEHRLPLVLLPQTYGPFQAPESRARAAELIQRATVAWARDPKSFQLLQELLGDHFDDARHRQGVDLAFALDPVRPAMELAEWLEAWRAEEEAPVVGLNVSGLVYQARDASERFGLVLDYRALLLGLVRGLLADGARVLLFPHVLESARDPESDQAASRALLEELEPAERERVRLPGGTREPSYDSAEAKWLISRLDWFCGTRMHSTVAGLSTEVPTCAVAYSLKTGPLFATVGVEDQVVDARSVATEAALETLLAAYGHREAVRERLTHTVPDVRREARDQMGELLAPLGLDRRVEA